LTPLLKAMLSISRAVEVKPLGPVQLHVPLDGCGPRFTVAVVELTVAEDPQAQLPFVKTNGVIWLVLLQLLATVMFTALDVLGA
jgi:hypothetical protein